MNFAEWEEEFTRMLRAQENGLSRIFNEFIAEVSPILKKYKAVKTGSLWHRNRAIEAQLEGKLISLQKKLREYMLMQSSQAWEMASKKTDILVNEFIKGLPISEMAREGLFARNLDALQAFQSRRVGDMNLSQRVWNICEQTKKNIEYYLQSGIAEGRSAAKMSQDVRSLLNNPDKRFRRIRDPETGKLKLSKPMLDYHPGQGVYRSSYKNALRMTRTETNMAYRLSDQARWQQLDFVTGYEVKRSANAVACEICDSLKGKYPKSFKFSTWHPSCFCYSVPILMKRKQFVEYLKTDQMPVQPLKTIPGRAQRYVEAHSKQFRGWKHSPYWLEENFTLKDGKYVPRKALRRIPEGAV